MAAILPHDHGFVWPDSVFLPRWRSASQLPRRTWRGNSGLIRPISTVCSAADSGGTGRRAFACRPNGLRSGPVRRRCGTPSPISCSCAIRQTWHGQRRPRIPLGQALQRPSGSGWCTVSSSRQPSARRLISVRAKGSKVCASALPATLSSWSSRRSTASRTVACTPDHSGLSSPAGRWSGPPPPRAPSPVAGSAVRRARRPRLAVGRAELDHPRRISSARGPCRTGRGTVWTSEVLSSSRHRPAKALTVVANADFTPLPGFSPDSGLCVLTSNHDSPTPGCSAPVCYCLSCTWRPAPSDPQAG